MTRTRRAYLTLTILTLLLCGCSPEGGDINDNPNAGTVQDQYDTLLKRPNIEQATQKYQQLLDDVCLTLQERYDLPEWEQKDKENISGAGC